MGRDFYEVSEPVDEQSVNKYFEFGRVSLSLRYLWPEYSKDNLHSTSGAVILFAAAAGLGVSYAENS